MCLSRAPANGIGQLVTRHSCPKDEKRDAACAADCRLSILRSQLSKPDALRVIGWRVVIQFGRARRRRSQAMTTTGSHAMASAYSSSDVPGEPALRTNVARKVGITQTKTANAKNICGRASRSARSWPCRSVNWRWNRASYRSNRPMPLSLAPGAGAHSVKEAGIASHRPDVASGAAKMICMVTCMAWNEPPSI